MKIIKLKRNIKYIAMHCTASKPEATLEELRTMWKEERGWKHPGYHYLIDREGEVLQLQHEKDIANGVKGYNTECIHIAYIGGVDKENKPMDNRNPAQMEALFFKIVELAEKYPNAEIKGHRDFPDVHKDCPCFDVKKFVEEYVPNISKAA